MRRNGWTRAREALIRVVPRPSGLVVIAAAVAAAAGCDAGKTKVIGADFPGCSATPLVPPTSLGVASFYGKYLDAAGIPILSSAAVADTALVETCAIVAKMLSARDDVREKMIEQNQTVVVIGRNEVTTDIPEYRNLYQDYPPPPDWDSLRGVGATLVLPVTSVGEENILCEPNVPFAGGNILVQVFATSIFVGLKAVDSTFQPRLDAAMAAAENMGLWTNTYALINDIEYYAEGVEDWFESNRESSPPDGTFNEINTRAELRAYDPGLAAIVAESMRDDTWRPQCP